MSLKLKAIFIHNRTQTARQYMRIFYGQYLAIYKRKSTLQSQIQDLTLKFLSINNLMHRKILSNTLRNNFKNI